MEQWKIINDNEYYEISNYGNVRNSKTKRMLINTKRDGYLYFIGNANGIKYRKRIHRLVAIHFIENTDNYPMVNHIDANKHNNRFDNLEWCTNQMNVDHAVNIGIIPRRQVINIIT
jgi:hypothetical protein